MFHIEFIQSSSSDYQVSNTKSGEIAIGEFRDFFHSSLSYWTQQQYSNQWKEGLRRICREGLNTSLITDMYDPNSSNIIQWWILRPKENLVYIRNELLFLEKVKQPFLENNIYNYIEERPAINRSGKKISEWKIDISNLHDFYLRWSET